ncbi:MAG TPA: non-homologous end-joining DNA ligase, partial [Polyangia bacterium]|nr:non-homologous end-joining DNA ligase [Polyangia bacterium]
TERRKVKWVSPSRRKVKSASLSSPPAAAAVALTHPDKLLYPKDGLTKQDLADYYQAVAEPMLRALAGRPVAFERWPNGLAGPAFFQQNVDGPAWLTTTDTPTSTARGTAHHLIVDREETLRWLAQNAVLTLHTWSARVPHLASPDWVVFDLDPAEGRGLEQVIDTALALRALLERLNLPSVPKTSGKRGLHVLVPLAPGHTHEDAIAFAEHIGRAVTSVRDEATMERAKAKRRGRLYFDCYQNGYGKTIVAPYSPRGVAGAPVSAPLAWSEVAASLDPAQFNLRTMPRRLERVGDRFAPALDAGVRLPRFR